MEAGLVPGQERRLCVLPGEIVAFTDDDVVVDRSWISPWCPPFSLDHEASCVTGLVLGAQLDTPSQQYFEDFGGFAKGFSSKGIYDLERPSSRVPAFPVGPGVSERERISALRKSALGDLWEFDPALGTGTIAAGGEDLDCFAQLILAGTPPRLRASGPAVAYPRARTTWNCGSSCTRTASGSAPT